jgi:GT2 family glycosyltransferase
VIVTYNSGQLIGACLRSLRGVPEGGGSVIVVDNASQDETRAVVRQFDQVRLIESESNLGFGGGGNLGARNGSGRYVLLLNPDTALLSPDLSSLEAECEEHGLASGLLVDEAGDPQTGFFARRLPTPLALTFEVLGLNRIWPSNPVNRRYRCLDLSGKDPAFVEQPPGAFLMVRRDVWTELGGMDESFYPVWFEDADLCRRARDRGYRIRFTPSCAAVHQGGHSVLQVDASVRGLLWYGSLLRYAAKHFDSFAFGWVCAAVAAGAFLRGLFTLGNRTGFGKTLRLYATIMRLAVRSLFTGRLAVLRSATQANASGVVSAVRQ